MATFNPKLLLMSAQELSSRLTQSYQGFNQLIGSLSDEHLVTAPEQKWTALQQLDHLIKSVSPVNMAFGLPRLVLSWKFGKANRPSRTYEQLVAKYQSKLQEGGRASGRFVPPPAIDAAERDQLLRRLEKLVHQLASRTARSSDSYLDTYILPHPLLGKLTLREMIYFTAYHALHHTELVKKGLEAPQTTS